MEFFDKIIENFPSFGVRIRTPIIAYVYKSSQK